MLAAASDPAGADELVALVKADLQRPAVLGGSGHCSLRRRLRRAAAGGEPADRWALSAT